MKSDKSLEKELQHFNVAFEKTAGGYYLDNYYDHVYTPRDAWRYIHALRHSRKSTARQTARKKQNRTIRQSKVDCVDSTSPIFKPNRWDWD